MTAYPESHVTDAFMERAAACETAGDAFRLAIDIVHYARLFNASTDHPISSAAAGAITARMYLERVTGHKMGEEHQLVGFDGIGHAVYQSHVVDGDVDMDHVATHGRIIVGPHVGAETIMFGPDVSVKMTAFGPDDQSWLDGHAENTPIPKVPDQLEHQDLPSLARVERFSVNGPWPAEIPMVTPGSFVIPGVMRNQGWTVQRDGDLWRATAPVGDLIMILRSVRP